MTTITTGTMMVAGTPSSDDGSGSIGDSATMLTGSSAGSATMVRGPAVRCALLHRVGAREAGVTGAAFAAVVHQLKEGERGRW